MVATTARNVILVPIGRFSEMTRLSVKALRLYDENGLLPPAKVDPSSGYRYYHLEQAKRAETIRALRSVDMPLEGIRVFLGTDNEELANAQLLVHRQRLLDRLGAQERQLAYLESIIQHKESVMSYEILITEEEPQTVATVRIHTTHQRITDDIATGFATLMQGLVGASVAGQPRIVYHHVIDEETDGDIEICVPVEGTFAGNAAVGKRELAGGTMATTVHEGPYDQITPAYHMLARWISENGYEIVGPPREVYVNDPRTVAADGLLTRIEFPIGAEANGGGR